MRKSVSFIITLFVLCANVSTLSAQKVMMDVAKERALSFFSQSYGTGLVARKAQRVSPRLTLANNQDEFYVFNNETNGGYIIVSGDERMPDVLGYSYEGQYDNEQIPCNMQSILDGYAAQVKYLRAHTDTKVSVRSASEKAPIAPLLTCMWDQNWPFCKKCPEVNGEHCFTGCVPTAMAQIMYYHRWPKQTSEVIPSYTTSTNKIEMPEIPVTTIDWDNMVDTYGWEIYNNDIQRDAVATLMLLCGASVNVDYDPSGSASIDLKALDAFPMYYDYDDALTLLHREWFDEEEWEQLIYDELHDGRPLYYSGNSPCDNIGHAFVVDGYDKDGYFHVNFGWGPLNTGYYLFTGSLNGYNLGQAAIVNLKPASLDSPKAYGALDNGKLTFYYDKKMDDRSGKIIPHLRYFPKKNLELYTACEFDASFKDYKIYDFMGFFSYSKYLESIEGLANLNTSNAVTMCQMFMGCSSLNSLDLSQFNTSKVTSMSSMFEDCSSLKELDLSSFDTEKVTDMSAMFDRCSSLESLNVSSFNTKNVTDMYNMFSGCSALKSLDLSHFITDNVTDMSGMFNGLCTTSLDISNFNTSKVTDMSYMFSYFYAPIDLDLSHFNTENVTRMQKMFYNTHISSINVSHFNTSKVTDMSQMFSACFDIKELNLSSFDTGDITDMSEMFHECNSLRSIDLSNFDTKNVTNMSNMFGQCLSLESLDLSNFNTENVTNMANMFFSCKSLKNLDISSFKTGNVTNMSNMFSSCRVLEKLDVSHFNTRNVTSMAWMFSSCVSLPELDLTTFRTENVTDMSGMFSVCSSLTGIDLSNFNTQNVTQIDDMFLHDEKLKTIYVSELWDMSNFTPSSGMFSMCNALEGSKGTTYMNTMSDVNHSGSGYAHIDGGINNPGYFTYKESTGIRSVIAAEGVDNVYSLSGVRLRTGTNDLNSLKRGMYIVNGKKIIVQ